PRACPGRPHHGTTCTMTRTARRRSPEAPAGPPARAPRPRASAELRQAVQLGGGPVGVAHDVVDRGREQFAPEHDGAARDEYVAHVARAGRADDERDRAAPQGTEGARGPVRAEEDRDA